MGECALHHAMLIADPCQDYQQLPEPSSSNQAYVALLLGDLQKDQLAQLPKDYQAFARDWLAADYAKAEAQMQTMNKVSSQLVAASVLRGHLSLDGVRFVVDQASVKGYQKVVIQWLKYLQKHTSSPQEAQNIAENLKVLESPSL